MRILHVGYFGLRASGAFIHSISPKLSRGLIRAGHSVTDFSDHDVARAVSPIGSRTLGVRGVNKVLLRLARDMRPDLLLLGHADTIRAETIAAIRRDQPAIRILQWNVDPLFEPGNLARLRSKLDVVDAMLVSTAGEALGVLRHKGMRLGFLPNPVDFSIESGTAHLVHDLPFDVFYACGNPRRPRRRVLSQYWYMDEFFLEFARRAPELRLCMPGVHEQGCANVAGYLYHAAMAQSAMGLNASRRNDVLLYSSDRLAHMIGNGLLILMERSTGYDRLFGPHEMGFFTSFDNLVALTRRLTAEPAERMAIAAAGRARYHELFNETRVARYVLDVAFDTLNPDDYEWPTLWE